MQAVGSPCYRAEAQAQACRLQNMHTAVYRDERAVPYMLTGQESRFTSCASRSNGLN